MSATPIGGSLEMAQPNSRAAKCRQMLTSCESRICLPCSQSIDISPVGLVALRSARESGHLLAGSPVVHERLLLSSHEVAALHCAKIHFWSLSQAKHNRRRMTSIVLGCLLSSPLGASAGSQMNLCKRASVRMQMSSFARVDLAEWPVEISKWAVGTRSLQSGEWGANKPQEQADRCHSRSSSAATKLLFVLPFASLEYRVDYSKRASQVGFNRSTEWLAGG